MISIHREEIEKLVLSSNLHSLKSYIYKLEQSQEKLLDFDNPSLVLLAIQVYLNPNMITHVEYQLEVITFLIKCGLSLFVPYGSTLMTILDMGSQWRVPEEKIMTIVKILMELKMLDFFRPRSIIHSNYPKVCQYVLEHQLE